jgi:hypothetical protein
MLNIQSRIILLFALLLFATPAADAEHKGYRGRGPGHAYGPRGHAYGHAARRYAPPPRVYHGGGTFVAGRFYTGRGYFYGGSFWARPYFGVGVGIPFGYGYATPRGCGYVDAWGRFYPAPCYMPHYGPY